MTIGNGTSLSTPGLGLRPELEALIGKWRRGAMPDFLPEETRHLAKIALAEVERAMAPAPASKIRSMLAALSLVLPSSAQAQVSDDEAAIRLQIYCDGLADVPLVGLERACRSIVRSDKWFPTIARLREVAFAETAKERVTIMALTAATRLPSPPPPSTPVDPAEVKKLLARLGVQTAD